MPTRFPKNTPSVFCLILTLFCFATPIFSQNSTIEAADKALEIAKRDTTNAVPYATALRELWQAYRQYLVAGKADTPDTLSVLLLNQDAVYQTAMDSLVKAAASVKKKGFTKFWALVQAKEKVLYQDMVKSTERFIEYHYEEMGNTVKSIPHYEFLQTLHIKLNDRNNYFIGVDDLAIFYGDTKKYELAQSILEKGIVELSQELARYDGLSKKDKAKPENEWLKRAKCRYTDLISRMCSILYEKGDINAAVVNGKKAIATMKETMKDTSYKAADFYNPYTDVARIYNSMYKPDSAIIICNESVAYYPKRGPNYFVQLITAYQLKGDMTNFRKTAMESYELAYDDANKASAEAMLFIFYLKTGQYTEARKWLDDYYQSILKTHNENSYMAGSLPNFFKGIFYRAVGEFDKAEVHFKKSIAIQKSLGRTNADFADDETELAQVYDALGQYDKSLKIKQQSYIPPYEMSRPRAVYWNILGYTYQKLEQLDSAKLCYEKSYAIFKTDKKTRDFALINYKLGQISELKCDYSTAEKWYQEAQSLMDSIDIATPDEKATCLVSHASMLRKRGKLPESLEKTEKSLFILRGLETSDFYRKALLNRALLHEAQQQNAAAVDSLQHLSQNIQKRIVKEFAYLSEQEKVAFMTMLDNDFFGTMQAAYARLYAKGEAAKSGALFYNTVLLQKELSLVDTRSLKRKAANLNDTLLFAELFKLNAFEEQIKSDKPMPTAERTRLTTEIAQIKANLEKIYPKLFEKESINLEWQTVQKQLKPNEIAIEFADVLNNDDDTTSIRNYYALVIKPDSKYPSVIPLFEEKELQQLLDKSLVKETFSRKGGLSDTLQIVDKKTVEKRYNKENGKKLYDLIWKPLENSGLLRGVQTVHFAPSGTLNRVAFAALPVGDNLEKLLIHVYKLRQYNTTRALFDASHGSPSAKDLVAFGDIQYGNCTGDTSKSASIETIPLEKSDNLVARSALFLDSMKILWLQLPASKREMSNIEQSHKKYEPTAAFTAFTGYNASEARFKTLGTRGKPSPSHLFISTHGFYNPSNYAESRYAAAAFHRTGVAMATANWTTFCPIKRDLDGEDGILTAYEIAQLNLSNTELVVLSGCQTGLGDIGGREGIFGLTRGFKLAGVNHIIASLWSVTDSETTEFMSAFYESYLSGKSVETAFEETQKAMQQKQTVASWAAWVLIK